MSRVEPPRPDAFFASRSGVCVYVSVEGRAIRVCFESLDGEGRMEGEEPPNIAAAAVAAATEAFQGCKSTLTPLFEHIAEASGPGKP
jgi:hypothetical protein